MVSGFRILTGGGGHGGMYYTLWGRFILAATAAVLVSNTANVISSDCTPSYGGSAGLKIHGAWQFKAELNPFKLGHCLDKVLYGLKISNLSYM